MIEQFRDELVHQGASSNTIDSYLRSVRAFVQWYEQTTGSVFDNKISVFDGREYKSYLNTIMHQKPTSINAKLTALQKYADFLYDTGRQEKVKIEKQKAVKDYSVKILNKSDLYKCRRWAHNYATKRDIAIFELILNTGVRESELVNLEMDDLTIGERKGNMVIRQGKGSKYRELPLNHDARAAVQMYLDVRPISIEKKIFLGQRGPLTRNAIYKIIEQIGQRGAGVELSPHMLRHQCFTAMAQNGVPLTTIAVMAGHSDPKLTAAYYICTSSEDKENAVNRLAF